MSGEPTSETWKGGCFFPGQIPEGLDLVIGDLGCAPHQMLGYRLADSIYHQAWPRTQLPAGLFDTDTSKRQEAVTTLATTANESLNTYTIAKLRDLEELLLALTAAHPGSTKRTDSGNRRSDAADETTAEILNRMWKAPRERQRLIAAGSADGIAPLIGKGATAVKTAGIIWVEKIKPALAAARYAARIERDERRRKGRS